MAPQVRPIDDPELERWVDAMHLAFHSDRPAADEADYRRRVMQQDLGRTLAAVDDGRIVGTLFSFPAELALPGGTRIDTAAISAVSVVPTHRRQGLLTRMIGDDLLAARERGELASILIAAEYPIYGRFGFGPAADQAEYQLKRSAARFTRQPRGTVEFVEPVEMLEVAPPLFDRFRRARPGQIDRRAMSWETRLGLREAPWRAENRPPRCAVYRTPEGEARGFLLYRVDSRWENHVPGGTLEVIDLIALDGDADLGLWRFCCEVDLIEHVTAGMRCVDEPLRWQIENARVAMRQTLRTDFLWLRPLDVPKALGARRYQSDARVIIEVSDPLRLCGGRFALEGGPGGATCTATTQSASLSMTMSALGAISLGGVSLRLLAEAGAIEELAPGALEAGDRLFAWPVTPWCSTFF